MGSLHKNKRLWFAKDTWDDKKDFPSSFVHDNRSNSRKDNLDQTHEHGSKVTVLKKQKKNPQKQNNHFRWKQTKRISVWSMHFHKYVIIHLPPRYPVSSNNNSYYFN